MKRIISALLGLILIWCVIFSLTGCDATVTVDGATGSIDVGFDITVKPEITLPEKPSESFDGNLSSIGLGLTSDSTMDVYQYGRGFKVDFEVGLKSDRYSIRTVQKSLANWLLRESGIDRDDVTVRIGSPKQVEKNRYEFYIIIQYNKEAYPYYESIY